MPNRILREKIIKSEMVNRLSWAAEVFYRRLMSVVDDFGLYDARPGLLRTDLFGLRIDRVPESDLVKWMNECSDAGLIRLYTVDNKPYLEVLQFNQTIRVKRSKYPTPPVMNITCYADEAQANSTCLSGGRKKDEGLGEGNGVGLQQQQSGLSPFLPFKPKAADLNELPDQFIKSTQEYLFRTNNSLIPDEQVIGLWNAWRLQNLHGDKTYNNETEVFKHFVNAHKTLRIQPKNKIHVSATTSELPTIDKEAAKRKYGG